MRPRLRQDRTATVAHIPCRGVPAGSGPGAADLLARPDGADMTFGQER